LNVATNNDENKVDGTVLSDGLTKARNDLHYVKNTVEDDYEDDTYLYCMDSHCNKLCQ